MKTGTIALLLCCLVVCNAVPGQGSCTANSALHFDGTNDYLVVPHAAILNFGMTDPFTVELWLRTSVDLSQPTSLSLLEKWNGTCATPYPYVLRLETGGVAKGASYDAINCSTGAGVVSGAPAPLNDGQWHHVAYVRDAQQTSRLFVDGFLVDTSAQPPLSLIENLVPLYIGRRGPGGPFANFYQGDLDEIRISSVARYSVPFRPAARFSADADTVLLLHLDEGAGAQAFDASGNGNHGLLGGSLVPVPESPSWIASTLPVPGEGLASSVNGGVFDASFKTYTSGDVLSFGIASGCQGSLSGALVSIFLNAGTDALVTGVTPDPLSGVPAIAGLNAVSSLSAPAGLAFFAGDGLMLGAAGIGLDLGLGLLTVGAPAVSLLVPPGLPPAFDLRLQAVILLPDAPALLVGVTNEVFLQSAP